MIRLSLFLLIVIVISVCASHGWTQYYSSCQAPSCPIVRVCPPPVVPQSSCCEPIAVFPPAPPLVAPIIVPKFHFQCHSIPVSYVPMPLNGAPPAYAKVRPKPNNSRFMRPQMGPRRIAQ